MSKTIEPAQESPGSMREHGAARFEHFAGREKSHFANQRSNNGEVIVWGADLLRAIRVAQTRAGDENDDARVAQEAGPVLVKERSAWGTIFAGKPVAATVAARRQNRPAAEPASATKIDPRSKVLAQRVLAMIPAEEQLLRAAKTDAEREEVRARVRSRHVREGLVIRAMTDAEIQCYRDEIDAGHAEGAQTVMCQARQRQCAAARQADREAAAAIPQANPLEKLTGAAPRANRQGAGREERDPFVLALVEEALRRRGLWETTRARVAAAVLRRLAALRAQGVRVMKLIDDR